MLRNLTKRVGARLGLASFTGDPAYSPIPTRIPPADDPIWTRRTPMHDIEFDVDAQLRLVEDQLVPYLAEFQLEVVDARGFEVWNGQYTGGDAELLYAMVRSLKPRRMIELGSGFSTLVSATAAAVNEREGSPTELVAFDPEPRTPVPELDGLARLERRSAMDVPLERFEALEKGDILFIDTSHMVKLGSEVNWLVLEVLPLLRPGVVVHFHDVFIPYEYPRYLAADYDVYFNEQYLVHAFLIGNRDWEVLLSAPALAHERKERLVELIPSLGERIPGLPPDFPYVPAALWLRRA